MAPSTAPSSKANSPGSVEPEHPGALTAWAQTKLARGGASSMRDFFHMIFRLEYMERHGRASCALSRDGDQLYLRGSLDEARVKRVLFVPKTRLEREMISTKYRRRKKPCRLTFVGDARRRASTRRACAWTRPITTLPTPGKRRRPTQAAIWNGVLRVVATSLEALSLSRVYVS